MAIAFRTSPVVAVLPFGHQGKVFFALFTVASVLPSACLAMAARRPALPGTVLSPGVGRVLSCG